jgi:hypothetical protein
MKKKSLEVPVKKFKKQSKIKAGWAMWFGLSGGVQTACISLTWLSGIMLNTALFPHGSCTSNLVWTSFCLFLAIVTIVGKAIKSEGSDNFMNDHHIDPSI